MSKTKFIVSNEGQIINLIDQIPVIVDELPVTTYVLKEDMKQGLFLERIDAFGVPDQLFGDVAKQADRVISTYDDRTGITGILLTGEKGSGKTLLGKIVATRLLAEQQQPIIVINIPVSGDDLGIFLQKINRPVTLFFDEFEKMYKNENAQNGMLTILDGVYPIRALAILTSNDSNKLIDPLINRPGRIYYKLDYPGLDFNFIMEYAAEKLIDKQYVDQLARLGLLVDLNFDQLQALIQEMNRYGESVEDAVQMLNISTKQSLMGLRIVGLTTEDGVGIKEDERLKLYYDGTLDFSDEDDRVEFWYKGDNSESLNFPKYYKSLDDDHRYVIANGISHTQWQMLARTPHEEPIAYIPRSVVFDEKSVIDVRRNGQIIVTSSKGATVTLEKPSKFSRKAF